MSKSKIDEETKAALEKVFRALEVFRFGDRDMPIGEAVGFLAIAMAETDDSGLSVTELSQKCDFSLASASRHMQALGQLDRHRRPGLEWVKDETDLMERRKKILRVTPQGRRVVQQLKLAMGA
jgi:hypothetical protein